MRFILILFLVFLSGCATVSIETPEGLVIQTRTLWKDIERASGQTEDMVIELGSSKSTDDARTLMAMCLLFPQMDGCK